MLQKFEKIPHFVLALLNNFLKRWIIFCKFEAFSQYLNYLVFYFLPQAANTTEYQGYTKYLEDVIKVPIKDLVHSQKSKVITELLLQLHSYPKRVMTGFSFIIKNDERSKWEGSKISKPELAKYIQPQFLGVLNFFDTNLKNETGLVTLEEKVDILSSLTEIIKLMGSEFVASVKHKILSTLNSGEWIYTVCHCHTSLPTSKDIRGVNG